MHKKLSSVLIIALLVCAEVCIQPAYAKTQADRQAQHNAKITNAIGKLGVGKDARISVKLREGKRIEGFIRETRDDIFVVADLNTGITTEVAYRDVKRVTGHNLSTGAKVAIGVGIAVGVLIVLAVIGLHYAD